MTPDSNTVVDASDLEHIYTAGSVTVRAVDIPRLSAARGEFVLLQGPSGSGKTTLISILGTLLEPTRGHLTINGERVDWSDRHQLVRLRASEIGFVFQAFKLLEPLDAVENVEVVVNLLGERGPRARHRAEEMVRRVGLGHRIDAKVATLSGGERQRIAIARALVAEPSIVFADEPTANLDSETGGIVTEMLAELTREGRAVIVASHDPRLEAYASRILTMLDGRIGVSGDAAADPRAPGNARHA